MNLLPIQICSLEAVREIDSSLYDGVITVEDSDIEDPFRVDEYGPNQLVLCFNDISVPVEGYVEPNEKHILKALAFAHKIETETARSLLIHCHAGISRSSAIALAIIAVRLGAGKELQAIKMLEKINPNCSPNKSMVWMTDEILERKMVLYKTAFQNVRLTN